MDDYRVIIAGSRTFDDYKMLKEKCNSFLEKERKNKNIIVISGGARGADKAGEEYAKEEGFGLEVYPADWKKFGKSAGFRRNEEMAVVADALIAFWDGLSHGTKHMIDIMKNKNSNVNVVYFNDATSNEQKG